MTLRRPLHLLALLLIALLPLVGCSSSPTRAEDALPMEFAVRSDRPYIRGRIVEREELPAGDLRLRVRVPEGVEAKTPEAIITVLPNAILRWADGDVATRAQLVVGRMVTVWVTGPELRSLPPQVGANGLMLHLPFGS